jgi:genome maintenance exonuclease 1
LSRRIFKHQFVPVVDLITETIDGQRHYVLEDGVTKLKSVTTILGEKTDKSVLLEWRKRVGDEEANRVSTQAARRGTSVHNMAEKYLLNEDMTPIFQKEMPINIETFQKFQPVLDKHIGTILGIETPLASKVLKCAGRTDLVAEYDGVLSIIDFKTSKRLKDESHIENYFLQATVYSMMFEWTYNLSVPKIVIMIAVDDESTPQIFIKDRAFYIDKVLEIFRG